MSYKVHLPNDSKSDGIGGGWSFRKNLIKYAPFEIVDTIEEADLCLVCGVTMITGSTFDKMKALGKKIVIRLDGIPEPWRNPKIDIEGRMVNWCALADGIVYQSNFTKKLLAKPLGIENKGVVIMNGADQQIFNPDGETVALPEGHKILTVLWRQDNNKRWDEVLMRFRIHQQSNPSDILVMVGQFPNPEYNYGFIFGERIFTVRNVQGEDLARVMRSCDEMWFPSFADPCPNTLIEALCCGLKIKLVNAFGGANEIHQIQQTDKDWFDFLSAKRMAEQYDSYFKLLI